MLGLCLLSYVAYSLLSLTRPSFDFEQDEESGKGHLHIHLEHSPGWL